MSLDSKHRICRKMRQSAKAADSKYRKNLATIRRDEKDLKLNLIVFFNHEGARAHPRTQFHDYNVSPEEEFLLIADESAKDEEIVSKGSGGHASQKA